MRTRKMTQEAILTRSVKQLLTAAGIFFWKNFGGPLGVKGVPDILGCKDGKMLGIELKAPKGVLSPEQAEFLRRINEAGGLAFMAKDLDTVIDKLGLGERFLRFR